MLKCPQVCQRDQNAESGRRLQVPARLTTTDSYPLGRLPLVYFTSSCCHRCSASWEITWCSLFGGIVPPSQQILSHRGDRLCTGRGYQRVTEEQQLRNASWFSTSRGRSLISLLVLPSLINKAPVCPRHSAEHWGHQKRLRSMVTVTHCQFAWPAITCPPHF